MKVYSKRIAIISFASKRHVDAVSKVLETIGRTVDVVDPDIWLSHVQDHKAGTSVFVLTRQCPSAQKLVDSILRRLGLSPHLVLYTFPLSSASQTILQQCQECCVWPCDSAELALHLERVQSKECSVDRDALNTNDATNWLALNLVGIAPSIKRLQSIITKSASCDAPLLVEGETGSGKEVAARAVHYLGARRDYPFIPVNCGAIPDHLIENELFGHEKGAYTDARQSYTGLIAQANGGTLFLDEIEALSSKGQVALLRFIEDKKIKPLGGKQSFDVNVRIIAASNSSLLELVAQGLFRQDLLFRLNLLTITLPPLRERNTDIQALAEYFLQKYRMQYQQFNKQLHPLTVEWMKQYYWPGNVRELENFIHRGVLMADDNWILPVEDDESNSLRSGPTDLVEHGTNTDPDTTFNAAKHFAVSHFEEGYLTGLMSRTNGNVTLAAGIAKKERRALGKLLKKHSIDPTLYRTSRQE